MTFKDLAQKLRNTYMSLPSVVDTLVGGFAELNPSGVEAKDVSFDKTGTTITSDNVEGAIKEVAAYDSGSFNETYIQGGVYKSGRVVFLTITNGGGGPVDANTTLYTLPAKYRPVYQTEFVDTFSKKRIRIATDGVVSNVEAIPDGGVIRGSVTYISAS